MQGPHTSSVLSELLHHLTGLIREAKGRSHWIDESERKGSSEGVAVGSAWNEVRGTKWREETK